MGDDLVSLVVKGSLIAGSFGFFFLFRHYCGKILYLGEEIQADCRRLEEAFSTSYWRFYRNILFHESEDIK